MLTPSLHTFDELLRCIESLVVDVERLNRKVDILERKEAKHPTLPELEYITPPISPRRGKPSHDKETRPPDTPMDSNHVIDLTS